MNNFQDFFELLKCIITKKERTLAVDDNSFSVFLANRYLSFLHPEICKLLAQTTNIYGVAPEDVEDAYNMLNAIIPKLPYTKIDYVSKPSSQKQKNLGIDDEKLGEMASYLELGKNEVRNILARTNLKDIL